MRPLTRVKTNWYLLLRLLRVIDVNVLASFILPIPTTATSMFSHTSNQEFDCEFVAKVRIGYIIYATFTSRSPVAIISATTSTINFSIIFNLLVYFAALMTGWTMNASSQLLKSVRLCFAPLRLACSSRIRNK